MPAQLYLRPRDTMPGLKIINIEDPARGDALVVCVDCTDILMIDNANVECVVSDTSILRGGGCVLVYTRCGTCSFTRGKGYDMAEGNIDLTEGYPWQIAMMLGFGRIIPSEPEFVTMDMVRLMITYGSRLSSAVASIVEDSVITTAPLHYVSGSFLQL